MAENSCETSFQTYQGVCRIRVEVTIKIKRGYGVREGRMCKWGAIGKSSQQADVCGQAVVAASASSFKVGVSLASSCLRPLGHHC